jgi:nitrogenase molybdenum-iron protein NifN
MITQEPKIKTPSSGYASTKNACKLCAPFGACIAFRGVSGCIPLIHGSQGCSTYIRRYGISHFREPIDIASSNFTESTAIFGGRDNLVSAIVNVTRQYRPEAIGVTSTCLSETIGENVPMYLAHYEKDRGEREKNGGAKEPELFYASTPSYRGTHIDGFHEAIYSVVSKLAGTSVSPQRAEDPGHINLISGFVSSEDLRELHKILSSFGMPYTLLPDYSETLDGGSWEEYQKLPKGGTPLENIRCMSSAIGTIALGESIPREHDAAAWLESTFGVNAVRVPLPIGIGNTDTFFNQLSEFTGRPISQKWMDIRGRLIDAYIDGHKYCFGKKAIVYGEEDFVLAISSFLDELGIELVLVATGAASESFKYRIMEVLKNRHSEPFVMDDADFVAMLEKAKDLSPDFVMGSSKGFYLAKNLEIPLIRCGFPIHDRMGGHRILHLGYRGTLNLFDLVCNTLMQIKQSSSKIGYTYI